MVSFEIFVKAMPPSLSELKVTPSFCFAFKIPDDRAVTNTYRIMEIKALICLFAAILQQTQWQMIGGSTTATTKRSDSNNQPIHCYVCYSCNRVETSQSLPCPSDHDRCMVSRNKRQRLFLLCNFSSI